MFVLPKTRRMGINTISHQPLVGEWRLMSHGRPRLSPQRSVPAPSTGTRPQQLLQPLSWGQRPQDWGTAGDRAVVVPPFLPRLCCGMLTPTKGWGCSSAGSLCSLWATLRWCFSSCFSCAEDRPHPHSRLKNGGCRWHWSREAVRHSGSRDLKESFQPAVNKVNFQESVPVADWDDSQANSLT